MVSQTSYYGAIELPQSQGGRLLIQVGRAQFIKKGKTVSIQVRGLRQVAGFEWTWRSGAPTTEAHASGLDGLRTTGTISSSYRIVVTRATLATGASAASFWYKIIGW